MRPLIAILLFFVTPNSYSQEIADGNYTVGILPVTTVTNEGTVYTPNVQASISKVFVEKSRFTVVDRTRFDQIAKERNLQKQEDFLNGAVVEQGKSLGAQYLISANINQISKQSGYIEKSKIDYDAATKQVVNRKIQVFVTNINLTVNVQIIDVATGIVKSNKSFISTRQTETSSEAAAVQNAVTGLEGYLRAWINDAFPVFMKIVRVESLTKKGLPDKVLIKGGQDMDLAVSKSILTNSSSELEVFEFEVLNVDGKEFKRQVTVGKVRIEEVQGEFSICKVRSGAEEIQKKINDGKTLLLKVSRY